jgi:hypothetical protein
MMGYYLLEEPMQEPEQRSEVRPAAARRPVFFGGWGQILFGDPHPFHPSFDDCTQYVHFEYDLAFAYISDFDYRSWRLSYHCVNEDNPEWLVAYSQGMGLWSIWHDTLTVLDSWHKQVVLHHAMRLMKYLKELVQKLEKALDELEAFEKYAAFLSSCSGSAQAALLFTAAFGGRLAAAHKHVKKLAVRDVYLTGSAREPGAGNELRSPTGVACTPRFSREVRYRVPSSSPHPAAALAA